MAQTINQIIYWSRYTSKIGRFYLAATINGLCFMGAPNKGIEELENWANKRFPTYELVQDDKMLDPYKQELEEYFKGERRTFSMPVDVEGTPFQMKIWAVLKEIPYGETFTYSQIANMINKPAAVRAVGTAIGRNPLLVSVPCHRVVGKDGSLTGYRGGLEMKKSLLQLEQKQGRH
ncbi:methylated-DNA--[protein]-cysteine S-methyltransferase [Bacillus gobiensis]|uniref:methylated-DNA--[protein]-cysteine S-methyltransferase n=1 Tax=Bacillus gobiensis TaxID=1441095 RepID=UPI003D25C941